MNDKNHDENAPPVLVWDIPTRLFHWTLVLLFFSAWITAEIGGDLMDIHMFIGYTLLSLALFRWVWGFAGSQTARFADFVRGPRAALAHIAEVRAGKAGAQSGHNPLGGWMVLALLVLLPVQACTGLFASDDILTDGPLKHLVSDDVSRLLTHVHHLVFTAMLILVIVHVAAIIAYRVRLRENLVLPMLTGYKALPPGAPRPRIVSPWRALLVFLMCAGFVALVVNLA